MKLRTPTLALVAASAAFGMSVAAAQTTPQQAGQPPFANPPYKNLKVFPQDITRPQLLSNMKLFSQSLGVRCTFCHVGQEGAPLSTLDFASDAKQHKVIARDMLRMAHRLNTELPTITGDPSAKINCYTCHRGSQKPATEIPPPAGAPPAPPAPPGKTERG